jgi:ribosome-binding protein aMBF1 (putative translation factor)
MEAHRRELGEHVRDTREAQGIRSQAALAEAAGISARSVAKVELGDPSTGKTVLRALERHFGWPRDSTAEYIARGGALPVTEIHDTDASPDVEPEISAARRRIIEMSHEDIAARIAEVTELQGAKAAGELLESILTIRDEARQRT